MDRAIRMHGSGLVTLKSGKELRGKIIVDFESLYQQVFVKVLNISGDEYLMPLDSIGHIKWDKIDGTGNWGGIGGSEIDEWLKKPNW